MSEHDAANPPRPAPIRTLSAVLSNQIAAGEVVERPASVVKELVENALDADAKVVGIELELGGIRRIRVRDDGFGIPAGELLLALSRHATSKIASLDDLDRIASMGFRGEALPSIASVSRLVLESCPPEAPHGARVSVDGGVCAAVEPAAAKTGTTVEVRDLFFNVPARRKFLRTPRTEFRHVEDTVRRLALARPDVSFTLHHDGRKVLEASRRMEPARRLARLLDEGFATSALEISFDAGDLSIHGYLAPPDAARSRPDRQFLFVNGRSVRDDVVRHAVRVGFGDTLASGQYPVFVLHLGVDSGAVDVNVHPTKHEVRFREPRHIHDFVRHAVARGLEGFSTLAPPETVPMALETGALEPGAVETGAPEPGAEAGVLEAESGAPAAGGARRAYPSGAPRPGETRVRDHLAAYAALSAGTHAPGSGAPRRVVRLGHYILVEHGPVEHGGKLLLIDLRAGRGALVRERLEDATRRSAAPVSRPLLIPHAQTVQETVADAVDEASAVLLSLGIEVRRGAPGSLTLRSIPACLAGVGPGDLLDTVANWTKTSGSASDLVHQLAALAESSGTEGHVDHAGNLGEIVDAAVAGRLGAASTAIDESTLRRIFAGETRQ